jgi:hypothetical protein
MLVRLAIAEDVASMPDPIARSLGREGMAVDSVYDGEAALDPASVTA